MRMRKPSPAMAVALVALVFSVTGTGIAASGVIDGSQIQKGSITADKLQGYAVVPKGYRMLMTPVNATTPAAADQTGGLPDWSLVRNSNGSSGAGTRNVLQCTGPAGPSFVVASGTQTCGDYGLKAAHDLKQTLITNGIANGFVSNRVTIPAGIPGVPALLEFAPLAGVSTAQPSYAAAQVVTSTSPHKVRNVGVSLVRAPSSNVPTSITVTLLVNDGTFSGQHGSCTFDPQTQKQCSFSGPIPVAAGATVAWLITTSGPIIVGQSWSDYDLAIGADVSSY